MTWVLLFLFFIGFVLVLLSLHCSYSFKFLLEFKSLLINWTRGFLVIKVRATSAKLVDVHSRRWRTLCTSTHNVLKEALLLKTFLSICLPSRVWRQCSYMSHLGWSYSLYCWSLTHYWFILNFISLVLQAHLNVQIVVPLVPPEILRARQSFSKEPENGKYCIRGNLFVHSFKAFGINTLFPFKTYFENVVHLFERFDTLIKVI